MPTAKGNKTKSAKQNLLSIILPVYEEAEVIAQSVDVVRQEAEKADIDLEFILVDDGSGDGTWDVLQSLSEDNKDVRAISFSRNFGKEKAIYAGLQHASGDAAIVMDSDLQHPPSLIPEMVKIWREEGVRIVDGIKADHGEESGFTRVTKKAFYKTYEALIGIDLTGTSDFKLLDRVVIDAYCRLSERNLFFRGMVPWLGYPSRSLPFDVQKRIGGQTKWSEFGRFLLGVGAVTSFSVVPLQFVTLIGFIFLGFSILLGLQSLLTWLSGAAVEGFTTVILLLLIIGSVLMVSLGIIGQYLARIYQEVKGRPHYLIRDKAGF